MLILSTFVSVVVFWVCLVLETKSHVAEDTHLLHTGGVGLACISSLVGSSVSERPQRF